GYSPELIDVIKRVDLLERQIKTTQTGSLEKLEEETIGTERVSPEILYGDESLVMIKAREVMKQGLSHLSDALISYNEELERENYIDLFWNSILELQYFLIRTPIDDNLEEGITMFQVALYNHRTMPRKRDEVVALKIVFEKFMNNIKLSKALLDECLDKIEEAGFDLSGPLAKIEGLHELE
ncbi:MAG: hypothetical protein ACRENW_02465, partial [Thermodesulfobacteriota bacterium]